MDNTPEKNYSTKQERSQMLPRKFKLRTSYKTGYTERQLQREFVVRLLQDGFAAPTVADYAERKYGWNEQHAYKVVWSLQRRLAIAEGRQ